MKSFRLEWCFRFVCNLLLADFFFKFIGRKGTPEFEHGIVPFYIGVGLVPEIVRTVRNLNFSVKFELKCKYLLLVKVRSLTLDPPPPPPPPPPVLSEGSFRRGTGTAETQGEGSQGWVWPSAEKRGEAVTLSEYGSPQR